MIYCDLSTSTMVSLCPQQVSPLVPNIAFFLSSFHYITSFISTQYGDFPGGPVAKTMLPKEEAQV